LTGIPYLDEVWNVTHGCTKVSAGCANCYAARLSDRFPHGGNFGDVIPRESQLDKPLHWRRPRRVGVCFMSDLFHERVPDEFLDKVFAVMALTPQHTYVLLTKRPERMRMYISDPALDDRLCELNEELGPRGWPPPNVWLGVSVENQQAADERIPLLLETPAAEWWLSVEPLLGAVDLSRYLPSPHVRLTGRPTLDWVVVGGESGPKARPMEGGWLMDIMAECSEAGVPVYVKQDSGPRPGQQGRIPDALWAVKQLPWPKEEP